MKNRIWSWTDAYFKRDYLGPNNKENSAQHRASQARRSSSEAAHDPFRRQQSDVQSNRFSRASDAGGEPQRRNTGGLFQTRRSSNSYAPSGSEAEYNASRSRNARTSQTASEVDERARERADSSCQPDDSSADQFERSKSVPARTHNTHDKPVSRAAQSMEDLMANALSFEQMADELRDFAEVLGINPAIEPHLMDIAEDFYSCPMPEGWSEHWADDDLVYYAVTARNHTQWEHPMEHFYKAMVFLHRTGFQAILEEQIRQPPRSDELKEMADYLGVNLEDEPEMSDLVKMAVGAPLPSDWHEGPSGDTYIHDNGKVSKNHPLDVYFLETIRTRREEKEHLLREGKAAIEQAQRDVLTMIMKAKGNNRKILGIGPKAGRKEIRDRYRELALVVHPDKNPQKNAAHAFQLVSAAFKELMRDDATLRSFRHKK